MIISDFILCALFAAAYFIRKGDRDCFVAFLSFSLTVMYSHELWFGLWDAHSEFETHVHYAIPFMVCFFALKRLLVKILFIAYVVLQLLMLFDVLLSGQSSFLYENYLYLQIAVASLMCLSLFEGDHNGRRKRLRNTNHHSNMVAMSRGVPSVGSYNKGGFRR